MNHVQRKDNYGHNYGNYEMHKIRKKNLFVLKMKICFCDFSWNSLKAEDHVDTIRN